ncbi:MAG: serine hydrolase [Clostridiales bacterium]|jgi:hypothetical protein|nr:serine hydrolase [Clostridiales bacterium]
MKRIFRFLLLSLLAVFALSVTIYGEGNDTERPQLVMAWNFAIYAEPTFESPPLQVFGPQAIYVVEEHEDGNWVLIAIHNGNFWININQLRIPHTFSVFEEPDFMSRQIGRFFGQVVTIYEMYGLNWALIPTYNGIGWVNLIGDLQGLRADLETVLRRHGNQISVFYENIENGYSFIWNPYRLYYAASLTKAPYALWIYQMADAGRVNLAQTFTYRQANYRRGSGAIRHMPFGTILTKEDLLRYNITHSCNVAFQMLWNIYGPDGFRNFIRDSGGRTQNVARHMMMSLNDVIGYTRWMHEFIESGSENGQRLRDDLINSVVSFVRLEGGHQTASKYGLWAGAMHDMAIVYSDSPYILIIMSEWGVAGDGVTPPPGTRVRFQEIAALISQINQLFE